MGGFTAELGLAESLELYLFLKAREEELSGAPAALFGSLRSYLYENLSIEDLESPENLLERLARGR